MQRLVFDDMKRRKLPLSPGVLWAILTLSAPTMAVARLPARSPFLSPQESVAAAAVELPLEFHGYMQTSDGIQFWVRDPARRNGGFVRLNVPESELHLVARSFDPEHATLTVERDGRTFTLPVRKAKIRSAGAATLPTPVPPRPGVQMPPRITQSVTLNPTPAQERERLDAITAEINRRRAMREQSAQPASPTRK